jgi:hypothetical protein
MIKGKVKDDFVSYEDILKNTSGGYDIFMYYQGGVPKVCKRPWGRDNHPSFGFFPYEGVWFWKDIAKEETGTAIDYVMRKFGLTFSEARDKILYDFGWSKRVNPTPVKIVWEPSVETSEPDEILFTSKPFTPKHHAFWNCAGVSEADCKKMECWAVKDLSIKKRIIRFKKDEIVFAYYAPEEKRVKVYFPEREKEKRFKNNVSYYYLWNARNVSQCDNLIVQKSMKDLIVTSVITPCVIATQNESVQVFNEEVVGKISSLAKNIFVSYGSDTDGKEKSIKITKKYGWKWVNTPNHMLPDINDVYLMAKTYGIGEVEKLYKSKGII